MDRAEQAALAAGLEDLTGLLVPTASAEIREHMQALARHACNQAIMAARKDHGLMIDSRLLARQSTRLIEQRQQTLDFLGGPATPPRETTRAAYANLVELTAELTRSQAQEIELHQRRVTGYRRSLHHQLPVLASEINQVAATYQDAERRMRDFFGTSKGLWDLEASTWRKIDWRHLDAAAAFVQQWPELRELARRLGRHWSSTRSTASNPPESGATIIEYDHTDQHLTEDLGRSEIVGLTQGRDLSILPASEIALLADPDGENLFYKRHAEGRLLNLEYITQQDRLRRYETSRDIAPPPQPLEQGPVIICTDSSGSMTGLPEQVAKALTLALARICLEQRRGCYLIAFSTDIQCIDLSQPVAALPDLLAFMAHSFRGGTDLRPALYRSLELLDNPAWINADLLIISDFRVPKLMIKKSGLIEPIRKRHEARLHALSIAPTPPVDDLHIFDSHWFFRSGIKGQAQGINPGQFKEI